MTTTDMQRPLERRVRLQRYGLDWSASPICVPLHDGYWTPWHMAEAEVARLHDAVLMARNVFEGYAALHREKGTADGNAKAALNQDLAARMNAALQPNAQGERRP